MHEKFGELLASNDIKVKKDKKEKLAMTRQCSKISIAVTLGILSNV